MNNDITLHSTCVNHLFGPSVPDLLWAQKYLSSLVNLSLKCPRWYSRNFEKTVRQVVKMFPDPSTKKRNDRVGTGQAQVSLKTKATRKNN